MEVKDTNPKDAVGIRKTPFSVIPWPVIAELGLAMLEGARKYGRHNYRRAGVRASVYFDANIRHMAEWFEGQDIDPKSGVSHVTKAIASLVVLRDSMIQGNWVDDRPPRSYVRWLDVCNGTASDIIDQYPDAVDACTENDSVTAVEPEESINAFEHMQKRAGLHPPGFFDRVVEDNEDVIDAPPEDNEDVIVSPVRKRFNPMAVRTIG